MGRKAGLSALVPIWTRSAEYPASNTVRESCFLSALSLTVRNPAEPRLSVLIQRATDSRTFIPCLIRLSLLATALPESGQEHPKLSTLHWGPPGYSSALGDGFDFHGAPDFYADNAGTVQVTITEVPEPSSFALIAIGLLSTGALMRGAHRNGRRAV